ncbi:hypothetical protein HHE06_14930 [Helicobacter heilmannii]|nr:hypothetical protein BN341_5170 [Helicobacter heilmannii ASB1.4]CRF45712.1 hypothetical protein HHE014_06830 [Helicobacter heilmannii]CRF51605.1 hypothetical protein HHE06_14930 [Helicobacter heilmannii]
MHIKTRDLAGKLKGLFSACFGCCWSIENHRPISPQGAGKAQSC